METKEPVPVQRKPDPVNNEDIFTNYSKPAQNDDPFNMGGSKPQLTQKQSGIDVFGDNMMGGSPPTQNLDPFDMTPQPVQNTTQKVNNQDDLDIFFGTSTNQPIQPPIKVQNRPSNNMPGNRNDVSGFTVYNELNTSNMKDMSAMGINNFLEINQVQNNANNNAPKFDLREESSGTIYDNNQNNNPR